MRTFWNWLVGEAGAGWIVGLIGFLLSLYAWLHRERAPKIIVQEISNLRLLDIHPTQRENLKVLYLDSEDQRVCVEDLYQKEIVIYNNGTVDIQDPIQLEVGFHHAELAEEKSSGFWRLVSDDPGCTWEMRDPLTATITLSYLNSYPVHKHVVRVYLISDEEMEVELHEGMGKGWSSDFVGISELERAQRQATAILRWGGFIAGGLGFAALIAGMLIGFQHSATQAMLSPTPENIEAAVSRYARYLEQLSSLGYFRATFNYQGVLPTLGWVLAFPGIMLVGMSEEIGRVVGQGLVKGRASSEFIVAAG
jgi:hypothetical protein